MSTHNYWAPAYNNGQKIDYMIELEEISTGAWRVAVDDHEFTMTTTLHASDFWGLVTEAVSQYRNR